MSDGGQSPTVGRIVHYNAPANDEFPARTLAALVVEVNPADFTVGLCVFGPRGLGFKSGIKQGDGQSEWNWLPRI